PFEEVVRGGRRGSPRQREQITLRIDDLETKQLKPILQAPFADHALQAGWKSVAREEMAHAPTRERAKAEHDEMTFARQDSLDLTKQLVRIGLVLERMGQHDGIDGVRCDGKRIRARANVGLMCSFAVPVPRKHSPPLRPCFRDEPIVLTPQPDLQQLPPEHLSQRLGGKLALECVDALPERRAQPSMQVRCRKLGHIEKHNASGAASGSLAEAVSGSRAVRRLPYARPVVRGDGLPMHHDAGYKLRFRSGSISQC